MSLYIAFDGDNVGSNLSALIAEGDDSAVKAYSSGVAAEMQYVASHAETMSAEVLMCSGDSLLFKVESLEAAKNVLRAFYARPNRFVTYSVGVAPTLQQAHACLNYAKLAGKNREHWWFDKTPWAKVAMFVATRPWNLLKAIKH